MDLSPTDNDTTEFSRGSGKRDSYIYHNYSTLVSDLEYLNSTYSNLVELNTAQSLYDLPDCQDGYKIWIIRITNESLGLKKPEVLFIGGHHGNEHISIETPYYLIEFLVQNYATNNLIHYLLDHREIYVMPVVNPWGWENNQREDYNFEDVNRDYPYGNTIDNQPFTTIGSKAVDEIMNDHIFGLSLSWHSGEQLIYYAWGTPIHDTINDESPDNIAYFEIAKLMSNYAGGSTKYPYGPANQMFYYGGVYGAWSDYAYAGGWDTKNLTQGYQAKGTRSLAFGIEISKTKKPVESTLGNSDDVLKNDGIITGFIPQNIRMALVLIDLTEPYLTWRDFGKSSIPTEAISGTDLNLSWYVNGSFGVTKTHIQFGRDPNPKENFEHSTIEQSGSSHWSGQNFTEHLTLPDIPGNYYFVVHAQVDQNSLIQNSPEPNVEPQSFYVQQRTDDNWNIKIGDNILNGSVDWYSEVIQIKIKSNMTNQIWFTDHDKQPYCNEDLNISWSIDTKGILNQTGIYWGMDPDPINNSEFLNNHQTNKPGEVSLTIKMPERPGYYYFIAGMTISLNNISQPEHYWSQIIKLEVIPKTPYELDVSLPKITYLDQRTQTLTINEISCSNTILSPGPLDDSFMVEYRIIFLRFDPVDNVYLTGYQCDKIEHDLSWSDELQYWYLPVQNVSDMATGWYQVVCRFRHYYGVGSSIDTIDLDIQNWFKVEHLIIVNEPDIEIKYDRTEIDFINILNVTGWCSKDPIFEIEPGEINWSGYFIKKIENNETILSGNLSWSTETQTWVVLNVDISTLKSGKYHVICSFAINEIGIGSSSDIDEKIAITIPKEENNKGGNTNENSDFILLIISFVIIIIIIMFIIVIITIKIRYGK